VKKLRRKAPFLICLSRGECTRCIKICFEEGGRAVWIARGMKNSSIDWLSAEFTLASHHLNMLFADMNGYKTMSLIAVVFLL
jgi:hypothetical protein